MSSLKDILKAKQGEMATLAANGAGVKDALFSMPQFAPNSNTLSQVSGMQGSAGTTKSLPSASSTKELNEEAASLALAVFEDTRPLRSVAKRSGAKLKASNGFFYPVDEEEVALLEDYAARGYCKQVAKQEK